MSNSNEKRILAVDFFRGLSILGVVITHCIIYGVFYTINNALATIPLSLLILLAPLVLMAPMAGLFAFISVVANTYTAFRRREEGHPSTHILSPILLTSLALLIVHFLFSLLLKNSSASMFHHNLSLDTLLPASLRQQQWVFPRFENLLFMDAMAMISMSGFITVLTLFFVFRSKASVNIVLNRLAAVGAIAILSSPFIWSLFWKPLNFFYFQEGALRLLAIPFSFMAARMHCLPGVIGFIIFGLWFGIFLHSRPSYEELIKKTRPIAIAAVILFVLSVAFKLFLVLAQNNFLWNFLNQIGVISVFAENTPGILEKKIGAAFLDYKALPLEFQFFGVSLLFWGFPFLLKKLDYCDPQERVRRQKRLQPVMRFGALSLTVFVFETPIHTLFAKICHTIAGVPVPNMENIQEDLFMNHPIAWISYAIFIVLFWGFILKFWERKNYRLSLEWILVKSTAPFRKINSEKLSLK